MASIRKEMLLAAQPEGVWAAMRDIGAVHRRSRSGFVVDCRLEGAGTPASSPSPTAWWRAS